jgi:hypothetical protein
MPYGESTVKEMKKQFIQNLVYNLCNFLNKHKTLNQKPL